MKLPEDLVEGRFLSRKNRFLLIAEVEGERQDVHLPNPGRLGELLVPGARLLLLPQKGGGSHPRKTRYGAFAVEVPEGWTTIDSRLPNLLFREALEECRLKAFLGYERIRSEFPFAGGRVDFLLEKDGYPPCLVEVKGCTLVRGGNALFPDAPTRRGARHLAILREAAGKGFRASVVFVIQRPGAVRVLPHREMDPDFAREAFLAMEAGVEFHAFATLWEEGVVRLGPSVPVVIPDESRSR